jgi:hypothetical protein
MAIRSGHTSRGWLFALLLAACGGAVDTATRDETTPLDDIPTTETDTHDSGHERLEPLSGPAIVYDPTRATLFDFPLPAPDLFSDNGSPDLSRFAREPGTFVDTLVSIVETTDGAGLASSVYFRFDASLENQDISQLSAVFVDLGTLETRPSRLHFDPNGGPHGASNLLAVQPVQGLPLAPKRPYAAIVLASDDARDRLGRSPFLADLLNGDAPFPANTPLWEDAVSALSSLELDPRLVIGLTVFVTQDPTSTLSDFIAAAEREPSPDLFGLSLLEVHDRFCVYSKTTDLPDFQHGTLPYNNPGEGLWRRDASGRPEVARRSPSRVFVTIPRAEAPTAGYPVVVFVRTGGGGDRPLIDRGPRAIAHGPPIVPTGTGPAMNFAAASWAGITWDGPHGGPRNPTGGDEQFLMFNVVNPAGTRDNIRQTALEAVLLRRQLASLELDTSACPGASPVARFDDDHTALMGHSMGGWIAPLALAFEPAFKAAILSGAGGSWSANIVYKKSPLEVRPLAETLLGYDAIGRTLGPFDPTLMLLQWAGESADPQVYGHLARNQSILMIEGIVDTYILPPIANATSLSLGLDLAGPSLDADPRLSEFESLVSLLPLSDGKEIPLPASGNRGPHTRVVVHAPEDGIEDGHEAAFQTPGPKHQYRCFLETLLDGSPVVPSPRGEWDDCGTPMSDDR